MKQIPLLLTPQKIWHNQPSIWDEMFRVDRRSNNKYLLNLIY